MVEQLQKPPPSKSLPPKTEPVRYIRGFAGAALLAAGDVEGARTAYLQGAALDEEYAARLADHGYAGDRDAMQDVLGIDIELNAQGLEFWLEKRKQ